MYNIIIDNNVNHLSFAIIKKGVPPDKGGTPGNSEVDLLFSF
jgi:hypothetical protein